MSQKGEKCFCKWKADGGFPRAAQVKIVRDKKDKGRPHLLDLSQLNISTLDLSQLLTRNRPEAKIRLV